MYNKSNASLFYIYCTLCSTFATALVYIYKCITYLPLDDRTQTMKLMPRLPFTVAA